MESPVVLDKPPEYHGSDRGFPFDEEEAWSDLAARHPDIAERLRQRQHPSAANWARKRRPSSQDVDDFGDSFSNFDRFPFDEIPPEFREHFPSHFSRRFGQERPPQPQAQPSTSQSPPQQQTTATQTEHVPTPPPSQHQHNPIPQYGLRNTVDLGQKSAQDPSLVDADERNQRSVSAPPESRNQAKMSAEQEQPFQPQKVRNIPIFVEGRDEPVINETLLDGASHFGETKPHHPQPPLNTTYFEQEAPPYQPPKNFSQAYGTPPLNKGFGQPFTQNKAYPQTYPRGRSQSPKPQGDIKIPVQRETSQQRPEPHRPQQPPKQQQPPTAAQQPPPRQPTPPPKSQQQPPDPISKILAIQTDVLNLMTEVENFTGTKKDKQYIFLDEMLTRNLMKLDTIEAEGQENIRNARKQAVNCIQKCIAVLEAKAEKNASDQREKESHGGNLAINSDGQTEGKQNGEVDMKETPKEAKAEPVESSQHLEQQSEPPVTENKEAPQAADTRPPTEANPEDVDKKQKKGKRDKSKDKSKQDEPEKMDVDDKGENKEQQAMEIDGAASQ